MVAHAHDENIVVDSDLSFRPAPPIDASRPSIHRSSVDWGRPLQPSSVGGRLGQNHLQDGTAARRSSGRDPPRHVPRCNQPRGDRIGFFVRCDSAFATDGRVRSIGPRVLDDFIVLSLNSKNNRAVNVVARRTLGSVREVLAT
jgi:hypothetical protein